MKAVIDEAVPRRFASTLRSLGCDVSNFPNSWKGLKNGKLLDRIEAAGLGCLVTSDRNMSFQQNIAGRSVAIVVLPAQLFPKLAPIAAHVAELIAGARPGQVLHASPRPDISGV